MSTILPAGELTGQVLLYNKPEPLSPEAHGDLGLVASDHPFAFAFAANAVPIHVTEFGPAGINYPIIFAGSGEGRTPLAVMSIRPNENLFITEGRFDAESYVPAFIRRYPFVTAANAGSDQMIVCIDADAGMLQRGGGDVKLFENGQPTDYTKNAIKFCEDFEMERQRTESFVKLVEEHDLFEERKQTITPTNDDGTTGEPLELSEYFAVSEQKLRDLPGEKLTALRDSGALQQIYIHLNSLLIWEKLVARTIQRVPQEVVANA